MLASTSKQAAATPPFLPERHRKPKRQRLPANGTTARTNQHPWAGFPRQVENPRPYLSLCPLCATLPARGKPRKRRPCTLPAPAPRRCAHEARHVVAEGEDTSRLLGAMARRAVAGHERGID
jgi:hypothetical protein